jgi:hypothetical protein
MQRVFSLNPLANRTTELLKIRRNLLKQATGLITGHCHLKGHLFKLGLVNSPTCERCHNIEETASHILCKCEALAEARFHHLGTCFMRMSDYHVIPPEKILHFARNAGLFVD